MAREYKDSGIEWIGRIPQDWKVCKLSYIYKFQTGATPPTNVESYFNGDIKWANISDLGARTIFDTSKKLSSSGVNKCSMNISPKGSLMYSFKLSVGTVSFCGDDMYTNEAIATFLEGHGYLPYLYYMAPIAIIHNANFNIYGAPLLNQELIRGAKIIVPPLAEQQAIASYLDTKCAEIDSLIELQEQMIAQLTDYKQSVITEAVTKGLNPEAELVPSGIDWIGDVPKGWKIKKVKYIVDTLSKGNGISKDEVFADGDTPCVRYGEIYSKYNHSFKNCVSSTNIAIQKSPHYFNHGDILCAGTGELVEEIGKSIVYLGEDSCLAGGDIIIITHRQNPSFLNYALNSNYAQAQKSRGKAKLKVVHISAFEIGSIYLSIPPLAEQQAIATCLDTKCHEIDSLIELKRQKIETLKEYKKSVIFEAVTGKTNID